MKGKFAIVIWALYHMKMFVKTDGSEAKSVREIANYIGQLFGLHFTEKEWKSTLAPIGIYGFKGSTLFIIIL